MNKTTHILSWILLFSLGLCATTALHGQGRSKETAKKEREISREIAMKEKELESLRSEIQAYEKRYRESEKKEKSTLENISTLDRQVGLLRNLIKKLREQEQSLKGDIQETRSSIQELERQLDALKTHYAKYVRSVYKYGRVYDVELLFSSKSVNQLYIRIEYLRRFSEQRAKDLRDVVSKKDDLEAENDRLQASLMHERNLLAEKTARESTLKQKVVEHRKSLTSIRRDKKQLRQDLDERKRSAEEVSRIIARLVAEEIKRKEAEAAAARNKDKAVPALKPTPVPETATGAFASQRGKLRWPVAAGTIASRYGTQIHPVLKTKRENTGIDIQVKSGTGVQTVADGEVSILTFIPGFGNILILSHGDGYRTVYAHLSEINVVESQKVKAGDVIARSGDSVEGSILHFEVWKGTVKQDPELWLAKQR
jgi:septal ring factor EnvC (AmiA/AmiB activator)